MRYKKLFLAGGLALAGLAVVGHAHYREQHPLVERLTSARSEEQGFSDIVYDSARNRPEEKLSGIILILGGTALGGYALSHHLFSRKIDKP